MNEPTLRLEAIEKRFGSVQAVAGVSLDVASGEFFSLLGPSGSGKTTMLRIIAGLETPDRGRVLINGRDVTLLPPYERGIGMVFQDFLLFPHKTVAENIAFPLRMQRKSAREQREHLEWVVRLVHLEGLESRYPNQLSGGQKQRVALARGLVARPQILLLDEPLANLDRELRKEMEIEVRRYQVELGIPFIYVTHNQEEALTMSDRIAVMNRGRLDQVGAKLEVYAKPATRFVAAFVGFSNRIEGRIAEIGDGYAVLEADGLRLLTPIPSGATPGAPAELFLKSERLQIAPGAPNGSAVSGRNQVAGTLADVIFKGQYVDFIVRLSGGKQLIASGSPELADMPKDRPVTLSWSVAAGDAFLTES